MEFYLIALLLILVIFVGTISLFYWLPKKLGYPKVGKYLAISVAFFFLIMILMSIFEDEFFTKKEARSERAFRLIC